MCDYPNPWLWRGRPFTSKDVGPYEGFVYLITNLTTGKMYIGRKYFWSRIKRKKRRVTMESDWKLYYGSSVELQEDVSSLGESQFRREILSLHKTRGATNYAEIEEQINRRVIFDAAYYNKSINGKYHNVCLNESEFLWVREESWHSAEWRRRQSEFMKKRMSNIIHITNGKENKQIPKDSDIPDGWRRGMTKPNQSDAIKKAWEQGAYANRKKPSVPVWNKGIPSTQETRNKISESLKGRPGGYTGKTHNDETRERMRLSHRGKKWYHHHETGHSKMFVPGQEPPEYIAGRKKS